MFIKFVCMVFYAFYLNIVNSFNATVSDANCHVMYTSGYGYNSFFHLPQTTNIKTEDSLYFNFSVMAPSNAHILLSTKNSQSEKDIVYEIVIGAGKNTFSTIRKLRTSQRVSLNTPSILTEGEFKTFWIRITNGKIDVGKDNDILPLVELEDLDPLDINYFAFGAWIGVTATWIYDCKNVTSYTTKEPKKLVDNSRLESYLLEDYDPFVIPVDADKKLSITASVELDNVNLDLRKSTLHSTIKYHLTWIDPKLRWNPSKFQNVSNFKIYYRQIWQPEFTVLNAINDVTSPIAKANGKVHSDGRVIWSPTTLLATRCVNPDISNWPWDTQECEIRLGLHSYSQSINLQLQKNASPILKTVDNVWKIEAVLISLATIDKSAFEYSFQNNNPTILQAKITLIRQSSPYNYIILLPVMCVTFISQFSFTLSAYCNSRIYLHLISLVMCIICLLVIDNKLPSHALTTPVILEFVSCLTIIIVIQTILTVFITNLAKNNKDYPPSIFVRKLLENRTLRMFFILPESGRLYNELEDISYSSPKFENIWFLLSLIVDRVIFVISSFTLIILAVSIYKVKNV